MNASKMIISLIRRSYGVQRRIRKLPNPGIQKRLEALEDDAENDIESLEQLDVDDEPDFMQAHESYNTYQKELEKNTELLKLRIVSRKYFKEVEPALLTHIEKEQIRNLHDSDPLEYTPEKLSESFPVLPHTIRKILKANWSPKSADKVLKHDKQVIENWKKFKRGELPLNPRLKEHLEKFKGRIISLPNREEVEKKLIPQQKPFAKPKSQLYSGIIKGYLDQKKKNHSNKEKEIVPMDVNNDTKLKDHINSENLNDNDLMDRHKESVEDEAISARDYGKQIATLRENKLSETIISRDMESGNKDFFTLEEFFKDRVKKMPGRLSIQDKVLFDTYKRKIESDIAKEKNIGSNSDRMSPKNFDALHEQSDSVTLLTNKDVGIAAEERRKPQSIQVVDSSKEMGLETYVKIWEKKASQDDDYPERIVIPKAKYKKGKLYKLRDCYYDHDGEFLYRVPGLVE